MNGLKLIALSAVLASVCGCASLAQKEDLDRLSQKVDALRQSNEEARLKVEELGNKFTLLHEKVDAERAKMEALTPAKVEPPEGLKVVKLEESAQPAPLAADGRSKKAEPAQQKEEKAEKPREPQKQQKTEAASKKPQPPVTPDTLYGKGQDFFMAGKYAEARKAFAELVKTFPYSNLADNALYWIGESYYTERDFDSALAKFSEAVEKYPDENKAPDALLKVGYTHLEMKSLDKAKEALSGVIKRYPDSEAAVTAQKTLDRLKAERSGE